MSQERKELLAQCLREYPTWGDGYIAEKERADALASVVKDAWGSLLAYWTDMPQAEVQRLIARCESVNEEIDGAVVPVEKQPQ